MQAEALCIQNAEAASTARYHLADVGIDLHTRTWDKENYEPYEIELVCITSV